MAEEDTTESDDNKPAKGSKKLLIIGIIVGLLLGGGGGTAAFMLLGGKDKTAAAAPKPVEEKPKLNLHFVKVKNVTVPLVVNNRVSGNIMFDFSLEVEGNDNKMIVIQNLPALRDAILRRYSVTPLGSPRSPHSIDYPRLKKNIKNISNKILHAPLVREVRVVQVRRF